MNDIFQTIVNYLVSVIRFGLITKKFFDFASGQPDTEASFLCVGLQQTKVILPDAT